MNLDAKGFAFNVLLLNNVGLHDAEDVRALSIFVSIDVIY